MRERCAHAPRMVSVLFKQHNYTTTVTSVLERTPQQSNNPYEQHLVTMERKNPFNRKKPPMEPRSGRASER